MEDRDVVLVGPMRDLLRAHLPTFDGTRGGLEVETWLIDLDQLMLHDAPLR